MHTVAISDGLLFEKSGCQSQLPMHIIRFRSESTQNTQTHIQCIYVINSIDIHPLSFLCLSLWQTYILYIHECPYYHIYVWIKHVWIYRFPLEFLSRYFLGPIANAGIVNVLWEIVESRRMFLGRRHKICANKEIYL